MNDVWRARSGIVARGCAWMRLGARGWRVGGSGTLRLHGLDQDRNGHSRNTPEP